MPGKKDVLPVVRTDSKTSMTLADFNSPSGKSKLSAKETEESKNLFQKGRIVSSISSEPSMTVTSAKSSNVTSSAVGSAASKSPSSERKDSPTEKAMHKWLDMIREFGEGTKQLKREAAPNLIKSRNYLKEQGLESMLMKLCDESEAAFRKESRVLKVKSPVVIIGDIHGNLHDLLTLDRSFFSLNSTTFSKHNFLFLGDYIDRGAFSVECIIFLFAIKVLYPKRFLLVRGNHEVAIVNKQYTFYNECRSKLGPIAEAVYERINRVFNFMPVCAVVDGVIFCAHGGVPCAADPSKPALIKDLENTPMPLPHPEIGRILAWEVMWNDPVETDEFENLVTTHKQNGKDMIPEIRAGFFPNFKRLTGHFYSYAATRKFLKANKLSCVVRAHEHCQEGVTLKQQGLCYTVFTTSKYATDNYAGVIVVEGGRIRPQKINTEIYPRA